MEAEGNGKRQARSAAVVASRSLAPVLTLQKPRAERKAAAQAKMATTGREIAVLRLHAVRLEHQLSETWMSVGRLTARLQSEIEEEEACDGPPQPDRT